MPRPLTCFNPRAREGRDSSTMWTRPRASMFQSTRPRGARLKDHKDVTPRRRSFNPRAREGRDCNVHNELGILRVSIHAPARGATDEASYIRPAASVSIHAPARGATPSAASRSARDTCFNPRAREGRDNPGFSDGGRS